MVELEHIEGLRIGNKEVFEIVYKQHFEALYRYAYTILQEVETAEEIVQTIFVKIWEKKLDLQITTSLKSYLYRSVYNACMNWIKHKKVKAQYNNHTTHMMKSTSTLTPSQILQHKGLQEALFKAIDELPEQCRTVFQLCRFQNLKYREVAVELNISEKTVENHMGKALKLLRKALTEYLVSIIAIFTYIKNNILE